MDRAASCTGRSLVAGPVGPVGLVWCGGRLTGIDLAPTGGRDDPLPRVLADLARTLADPRVASGGNLPPGLLALDRCGGFARRVLTRLRRSVPPGTVIAYGRLAELVGCPDGARAVARAMAANPFPLVFPCHRVVCADGAVGGFMRGRRGGETLKLALLGREGVPIRNCRVAREVMR